jgi:hypothetical protein
LVTQESRGQQKVNYKEKYNGAYKVFDNEKEEEIANEQNNHPLVVDIA